MDTSEFLRLILPEEGVYFLALFKGAKGTPPAHVAYHSLEDLTAGVAHHSANPQVSVYHACAAYQQPFIEMQVDGVSKKRRRIRENWLRAKAFWIDVDCGEAKATEGKGYPKQADAARALFEFADRLAIPRPMLVSSGYGVHAYWPLTKAIRPEPWCKVAEALKAALAAEGVLADPTRTADFASVLRPVGSVNRKRDAEKTVRCLSPCEPVTPESLATALRNHMKPARPAAVASINDDLTGHLEYPNLDSSGAQAATGCAQMAAMRDTRGDVEYEHWRGVIGVLKHCIDGEALAELWSEDREATGHDSVDWRTRYDTWSSPPTTCEFFEKLNPPGCLGCPHKGKIKSPIMLGRVIPAAAPRLETVTDTNGEAIQVQVPALPAGYHWDGRQLMFMHKDQDGLLIPIPFANQLFYMVDRVRNEDGSYSVGMRLHLANGRVRTFEVESECFGSNSDTLRRLAKYEVTPITQKGGAHIMGYLLSQFDRLKAQVEEQNKYPSFGWVREEHAFLVGRRMYQSDGSVREVMVGREASKHISVLEPTPTGAIEGYAEPLNYLYNRTGMEHWQYTVCSGWGSILAEFGEELYKGMIVALRGGDSGKGKTTACYASLYAFGDAQAMTLAGGQQSGFTTNALYEFMGVLNNLPILADELTNMESKDFSTMAYTVSSGQNKMRMRSTGSGVELAKTTHWRMIVFATGNKDFLGVLAAEQANSQAEAMRLIQLDIDRYPKLILDEDPAKHNELIRRAVARMKSHRGVAGAALVRYAATHMEDLQAEVSTMVDRLAEHLPDSKYRFYRNQAACTLVIARVARELGICEFDLDALFLFTVTMLQELADTVSTTNTVSMDDAYNQLVSDLMPRIISTVEYRDARSIKGPEQPRDTRGALAGRYVYGDKGEFAGQIIFIQKAVRAWCTANRIDYNALIAQLEADGVLSRKSHRINITRGTHLPTNQQMCLVVDASKLDAELSLVQVNSVDKLAAGAV